MIHTAPSPAARRDDRRQRTSAEIVDAALAHVEAEGFETLTMQRLAHELGFAVGALYRYFPSKDGLLLAVQQRVLEHLGEDLGHALTRIDEHARRARLSTKAQSLLRVLVAVASYRTLPARRPQHFAMMCRWLGDPRPLVDPAEALPHVPALLALLQPIAALFDEATAAGALTPGPGHQRLILMLGALQGVLQLQKLARFGVATLDVDALADEASSALCLAWGAERTLLHDLQTRLRRLAPFTPSEPK
ncbi:MAG: helix-turn-helix domain-containing protein [Deltaproteobacteria bacterium]|nr:helix-turn-helix domain-containing protein [Deltaproteobacteria bacterium]